MQAAIDASKPRQVADMTPNLLDQCVALARGHTLAGGGFVKYMGASIVVPYHPCTNAAIGFDIIEKSKISLLAFEADDGSTIWGAIVDTPSKWSPVIDKTIEDCEAQEKTPLLAAMRAYVLSVFGKEVPSSMLREGSRLPVKPSGE